MPIADPIEQARTLLKGRLADLEKERERLERARAELGGGVRRPRGRQAKKARTVAHPGSRKKSRRRRRNSRADQVLAEVVKQPGIIARDVAKALKAKPPYIYRVIADLEEQGMIKKKGRQLFPKG